MSRWLPPDWSTHGHHIDQLLLLIHLVIAALFLGWLAYFCFALWRFRARPGGSAATLPPPRGRLALGAAFVLAGLELALLFAVDMPVWQQRLSPPPEELSTVVRVVGEQYAWNFHYPGEDGVFGAVDPSLVSGLDPVGLDRDDPASQDDLVTINQLHVPLGKPVILLLRSKDVIHSFSIPYLRVKQDVIPGREIVLWFESKRTGSAEIGCAQLCGLGHYRMRGELVVEEPERFEEWYESEMEYM